MFYHVTQSDSEVHMFRKAEQLRVITGVLALLVIWLVNDSDCVSLIRSKVCFT